MNAIQKKRHGQVQEHKYKHGTHLRVQTHLHAMHRADGDGFAVQRRVCIGTKKCFTHRRRDEGLLVKRSNLAGAGKGLFATKIGSYRGEVISKAQLNNRYGQGQNANAPYALSARNTQRILDAGCERGILSIANSGRTRAQCNARYSEQMKQDRTINVFATKRINAGDEILIWYGPGYWASAGNSRHTTK